MSQKIERRSEPDVIKELQRRVANLERRIFERDNAGAGGDTIRMGWAVDGVLTTGTSHGWPLTSGDSYTLDDLSATLDTAGSTTTTLEVRKNGVAVATLDLAAGITSASVAPSESYADGDLYTIAITAAGTGAADLQTFARFVS